MSWQGIFGVDQIALQFARANRRKRLGGSFLFVGPNGVGKRTFAFALAKTLLCRRQFSARSGSELVAASDSAAGFAHSADSVDSVDSDAKIDDVQDGAARERSPEEELARFQPCGKCESCRQFELRLDSPDVVLPTHPDFYYLCKPPERSLLPLELLVGDKENRSRDGLCSDLNKTAFLGGRKIAVVDDADFFNQEGANALLKTLEEPPPNALIFLLGTTATKQLPTIRSRCQTFRFQPLANEAVARILLSRGRVETPEEADAIARRSGGSLVEAEKALDRDFAEFRQELSRELSREPLAEVDFAARLNEFVDAAGKEAVLRRRRLQAVLTSALDFYRGRVFGFGAASSENDGETAIRCAERTVDALEQIDRNANLPLIVDSWAYDLAAEFR